MENLPQMITVGLLWAAWCFVHSLLISPAVTRWLRARLKERFALYRLFYNLFSLVTLAPVIAYGVRVEQRLLFDWPGAGWDTVQTLLFLGGFVLCYGGTAVYDMKYVLGIRQWRDYAAGRPPAVMPFKAEGVMKYVRHPWYSGGILLIWSLGPITDVGLAVRLVITAYLLIGTLLEERKLKAEIGEPYQEYCRQVPMLIPWKIPAREEEDKGKRC